MRAQRGPDGGIAAAPSETKQTATAQRTIGETARGAVVLVGCFVLIRLIAGDGGAALRAAQTVTVLAAAAAAGAALASGWGRGPLTRQTWALIGVGCTMWAIGRLAAMAAPGLPSEGIEAAALANTGTLAMVPLWCAGILQLFPARRRAAPAAGITLTLDVVIVLTSLCTIAWFFVVGPIWLEHAGPGFAKGFVTAHAIGNVALLLAVAVATLRQDGRTLPPALVAMGGGVGAFVVADTLSQARWLDGQAGAGIVAETAWVAGFLGIGLAGLWRRRSTDETAAPATFGYELDIETGHEPLWRSDFPYALALTLLLLTVWQELTHHLNRFGAPVLVGCLTVVGVIVLRQALSLRDARRLTRHLSHQVDRDPLTGLINHRKVHERIDRELAHGLACGHPVAIALLDVDDFKRVNDTRGHQAGDHVLRALAAILADACRATDVAGRYAGDEFMLVLPGLGLTDARTVAERVVRDVRHRAAELAPSAEPAVSVSIGVAVSYRCQRPTRQLVAIADAAMYDAKEAGKNRVVVVDADTLIAEPDPNPDQAPVAARGWSPGIAPIDGQAAIAR